MPQSFQWPVSISDRWSIPTRLSQQLLKSSPDFGCNLCHLCNVQSRVAGGVRLCFWTSGRESFAGVCRDALPPEELEKFEAQYQHIQTILHVYETDPDNFSELFSALQQV